MLRGGQATRAPQQLVADANLTDVVKLARQPDLGIIEPRREQRRDVAREPPHMLRVPTRVGVLRLQGTHERGHRLPQDRGAVTGCAGWVEMIQRQDTTDRR